MKMYKNVSLTLESCKYLKLASLWVMTDVVTHQEVWKYVHIKNLLFENRKVLVLVEYNYNANKTLLFDHTWF